MEIKFDEHANTQVSSGNSTFYYKDVKKDQKIYAVFFVDFKKPVTLVTFSIKGYAKLLLANETRKVTETKNIYMNPWTDEDFECVDNPEECTHVSGITDI